MPPRPDPEHRAAERRAGHGRGPDGKRETGRDEVGAREAGRGRDEVGARGRNGGRGTGVASATYGELAAPITLADRVSCLWWVRPGGPAASSADGPGNAGAQDGPEVDRPASVATIGEDAAHAILPDGSVDLVWHAGGLTVAGPDTRARPGGSGAGAALGVRLRPGAAATFGVSGAELRDQHPTAEELWGAAGRLLAQRAADAPDDRARLALLVDAVARHSAGARPTDPVVDGATRLLARGGATVAGVAAAVGVGERLLRRRFLDHVGYGPKTLGRVLRLQRLLTLAITTDEGLAGLAALVGYADQAHLGREARALTGTTPARLVAARRP